MFPHKFKFYKLKVIGMRIRHSYLLLWWLLCHCGKELSGKVTSLIKTYKKFNLTNQITNSKMSHEGEKLTGIHKYLNSTTMEGRANVSY